MLAKKLKLLKFKLIDWNKNIFGHLDTRMFGLLEKVKVLDAKEQQMTLTHDDMIERFELKGASYDAKLEGYFLEAKS